MGNTQVKNALNGNTNSKKFKILIFSADDRNVDFIDVHKNSTNAYCKKHGYDYIYHNKNYDGVPVYWSKLMYMKQYLEKGSYDYVMWMDTDANVIDTNIRIEDIINEYDPTYKKYHIYIGNDYFSFTYNAGLFIIKTSPIGISFINQCIDELKTRCVNSRGEYDLGKIWAGICYEQGRMNKVINESYIRYTVRVPPRLFMNTDKCVKDVFILHKFGPKNDLITCLSNIGAFN